MQYSSRREFMRNAGLGTLGLAAVSGLSATVLSCAKEASQAAMAPAAFAASPVAVPWPYVKLDPVIAAERAYKAYSDGGCMYGAFEGIIGELRDKVGAPYDAFPAAMMKYGGAGVQGWGTLCGCLNGAAAALFLITDQAKVGPLLINEVFGWYGTAELPDYKPVKPKFASIQGSVANSQLCHVSVTRWCDKAGFKALSPERAERCAWLTASVARYTADLLNKQADDTFKPAFALPESVTGCLSCHGKGGAFEDVHMAKTATCTECHADLSKHPQILK